MNEGPPSQINAVVDVPGFTVLENCPACKYSLQGLTSVGACPECGFRFDEQSMTFQGIARGLSHIPMYRRLLWLLAALLLYLSFPLLLMLFEEQGWMYFIIGTAVLIGLLVYLLTTGSTHKHGMQTYLFCQDGFGVLESSPNREYWFGVWNRWSDAKSVTFKQLGPDWCRVRIKANSPLPSQGVLLDVGVRIDTAQQKDVEELLNKRISQAECQS